VVGEVVVNATKTCKRHNWGLCLLGAGDKHCVQTCLKCGDTRQHGQRLSDQALAAKAKAKGKLCLWCFTPAGARQKNVPPHDCPDKSQTRRKVR
jgi:hypothetical protein